MNSPTIEIILMIHITFKDSKFIVDEVWGDKIKFAKIYE